MTGAEDFDQYAENYDYALNQGLSATGESKEYFARRRVLWLGRCLAQSQIKPKRILDYGCGTGATAGLLLELSGAESVIGVDTSPQSLEQANKNRSPNCQFLLNRDYQAREEIDLAYCNGVFHHIPPPDRAREMSYIMRCLRPGGMFALWENNPWNPGTQYVMSRIPFDREAVKLSPIYAKRLLRESGFEVLSTDFLFFFPGFLKVLRSIERFISSVPVGGQYLTLCRRPVSRT
jgi:SAM-dependent methyltransferase